MYSTYLGGSANEEGFSIAVDTLGNAYVTGGTYSTDFPLASPTQATLTSDTIQCEGTCQDAFVTKLNSTGSLLIFSTFLGGTRSDSSYGIALDPFGNAYVTGYADSTNFPTTPGAFQTSTGGGTDAFVAKLAGLALPVASLVAYQPDVC